MKGDLGALTNNLRVRIAAVCVVYFDQLSGAACTQKLVKLIFQTFFVDFRCEITEKGLKLSKKVENA